MPVEEMGNLDFKFMYRYIVSKEMKNIVATLKSL